MKRPDLPGIRRFRSSSACGAGTRPPSRLCAPVSKGSKRSNRMCEPLLISMRPARSLQPSTPINNGRWAIRRGRCTACPVAVKDIIDTADFPTEYGGEIFRGRQPERDATIVKRLRSAGAIVIGKTVTSQYALFVPGPTRNPRDLTRTPGGSSSGSAAAVAAGFVPVALGTQTNGSVIRPASYCGIVGFKPSLGVLPRTGVLRHSALIDHPGVFAESVADAALVVDAIAGEDVEDSLLAQPARCVARRCARPR